MQFIFDVDEQNIGQIIQSSLKTPVLFYFWSERSQESSEFAQTLTKIATEKQGQFVLAKLNCDAQAMIASQFGIRGVPCTYLFKDGQPVDGFEGVKTEAETISFLSSFLPDENELNFIEAQKLLAEHEYQAALPLLKSVREHLLDHFGKPRTDVALLLTKTYIELKQLDDAKEVLSSIPKQDHDSQYHSLLAEIEILEQAADSPELKQLESQFQQNQDDEEIRIQLALQYTQVGRNQEALELLFEPLKQDLNAGEGKIKKSLLDVLSKLGVNHPLATEYRRKLYSLLY